MLFFALLFVLAVVWIDVREVPWRDFWARTSFLNQFRYPTRMLIYGACAVIVLAGLGLEAILSRIPRRISYDLVATAVFLVLLVASFSMFRNALVEGPLWFRDYGLYGMQYGAEQLFEDVIPGYLERDPRVQVMVSSTWANGTDRFPRFFLSPKQQARVQMRNVDYYGD